MHLHLSDEQKLLADAAARLFGAGGAPMAAREAGAGWARALWREVVAMGLPLMRVPAAAGGSNAGLMEAVLVCEAAGRAVAPVPIVEALPAARLLATLAPDALSLLDEAPLGFSPLKGAARLSRVGDEALLHGAEGATRPLPSADDLGAAWRMAEGEVLLLRAAWLVGAATRALELAADYARERHQFGRPIGSFQGVAHPLADSFADIEAARLLVWRAVWEIAAKAPGAAATLGMAHWWAATAARRAGRRALRAFGGYGLTHDYDIHLYHLAIQRAALAEGDPERGAETVARRLFAGEAVTLPAAGDPGIDFAVGAPAEALAARARAFFAQEPVPTGTNAHDPGFYRRLAAAGLAFPDWPERWGGEGADALAITALGRIFADEHRDRVPIECTNMGARMVMAFGGDDLQPEVLPRLAAGEALSCLGFSEPASGSDMYAARTRAVADGGDWVIDGQKMFTTGAHNADYVLLLARTDPDAAKHRGITLFFVPLALPGVSIQPVHTIEGKRTNITFYDSVRVPDRYRLGAVNGGLEVMAAAMRLEHGGEGYHVHHRRLYAAALRWAHAPGEDNDRPIDRAHVQQRLARAAMHLVLADGLCRRATWAGMHDCHTRATGPMAKLFATEILMADAADLLALAAPESLDAPTGDLALIEQIAHLSIGQTLYGGTSEVHRGIIAEHALGLPR